MWLQLDLLRCTKHICFHGECQLQIETVDFMVKDPLKIISILWVDGLHVTVANRDVWLGEGGIQEIHK